MFELSSKKNSASNIFQMNNKLISMTSRTSIVNFEHILHFTLQLLLPNLNKQMPVGSQKL